MGRFSQLSKPVLFLRKNSAMLDTYVCSLENVAYCLFPESLKASGAL